MAANPDDQGEVRRMSRGRRWMLRLLALVAVILIATMIWSTTERRGLVRRLDALRQAGAPAKAEDLNVAPTSDSSNAAIELRAAAKMINTGAPTWKAADELWSLKLPLTDAEIATLSAAIAPNAKALTLVAAATRKPDVNWGISFQSPMLMTLLPDLGEQRTLMNLLGYEARVAHQAGDDATAIRHVRELLFMSSALERQPLLVSHLVALGASAFATELIGDIAPDLRISGSGTPRDASTQDVQEVIRVLLDESEAKAGLIRALEAERVSQVDTLTALAEGRLNNSVAPAMPRVAFLKPLVYRNASVCLDSMNIVTALARETTDMPAFRARFAASPTPVEQSPRLYFLARLLGLSGDHAVQSHYRVIADRRAAAVALAIAMYRSAHAGALPKTLDELVPAYLPAIPADPLAAGAKPLLYLADPKRPRVYSVGINGVDDGGRPADPPTAGGRYSQATDQVVDLIRQPKPAPPGPDEDDGGSPPSTAPATTSTTAPE